MFRMAGVSMLLLVMAISSASGQEGMFSRDQLIEDTRQLADIIENVHPDPYINGGATLVGTPSGQAANVFGALMNFDLDHSGLAGYVSQMLFESTVLDAESARVIMPHHVLTYDKPVS